MASVLITGTSTGIGLATALTLGRAGHEVYATMRNPSRAPELGERAAQEGLPVKISVMDVDSDSSVKTAIADIHKDAGHIDVLVNNAGVERNGSVEELALADFRAVMETNYFGSLRCIHAVVPQMRQRKSGCIINVTSVAGRIASSPLAPYTASKFALEALSEALAQEMKTFNVRVVVVEPGIIETPMARRLEEPSDGSPFFKQYQLPKRYVRDNMYLAFWWKDSFKFHEQSLLLVEDALRDMKEFRLSFEKDEKKRSKMARALDKHIADVQKLPFIDQQWGHVRAVWNRLVRKSARGHDATKAQGSV